MICPRPSRAVVTPRRIKYTTNGIARKEVKGNFLSGSPPSARGFMSPFKRSVGDLHFGRAGFSVFPLIHLYFSLAIFSALLLILIAAI